MNDRAKHNVTHNPDAEKHINNNSVHSVYVDPETEERLVEAEKRFRRARSGSVHDSIVPRQVDDVWTKVNKLSATSTSVAPSSGAAVEINEGVLKGVLRNSAPTSDFYRQK